MKGYAAKLALQAAARRAQREGGSTEAIVAWVQEALAASAQGRGRPCPSCTGRTYGEDGPCSKCRKRLKASRARRAVQARNRRAKAAGDHHRPAGPDLAWQEAIAYGSRVLRMTDATMARELGVSRERIRQIRKKAGIAIRLCACGVRILTDQAEKCAKCAGAKPKRVLVPCSNCGKPSIKGRCRNCTAKARYKEDPSYRERHAEHARKWRENLSPEKEEERRRKLRAYQRKYGKARRAAARAAKATVEAQP